MTSPTTSPGAFHTRPNLVELVKLPPVRRLAYRCTQCGREFTRWRTVCSCHASALLHAVELDPEHYRRLAAKND